MYYGSLSYNWTSTSAYNPPRSFIAGRTSSIVTTTSLHSYDYEDHTCTAYDESGRNGSAVFRISLSGMIQLFIEKYIIIIKLVL